MLGVAGQSGHRALLTLKTWPILFQISGQHLDRHHPIQFHLPGPVHHTETTTAHLDRVGKPIRAQLPDQLTNHPTIRNRASRPRRAITLSKRRLKHSTRPSAGSSSHQTFVQQVRADRDVAGSAIEIHVRLDNTRAGLGRADSAAVGGAGQPTLQSQTDSCDFVQQLRGL
ncbi:hypothetical protein OSH90_02485 [Mycobacterium ulcerans]